MMQYTGEPVGVSNQPCASRCKDQVITGAPVDQSSCFDQELQTCEVGLESCQTVRSSAFLPAGLWGGCGTSRQTRHAGTPRTQTNPSLSTPAPGTISSQETVGTGNRRDSAPLRPAISAPGEQRHTVALNSLCAGSTELLSPPSTGRNEGHENHYKRLRVVHLERGEAPNLTFEGKRLELRI